uniref:Uncharacterized protein n=1 Tax=Anguilla anguilla TaxID=7936 RepID=A0A0E9TB45_ANGAN
MHILPVFCCYDMKMSESLSLSLKLYSPLKLYGCFH